MTHTIFDLHTSVLTDYRDFVQSFIQIADERARIRRSPSDDGSTSLARTAHSILRIVACLTIRPGYAELHTYRGRQGADVAMLVRRLKERFDTPALIHIGTSATMVARPDATAAERRQTVAAFASRFFGHSFSVDDVIEETLTPLSEGPPPSPSELRAVIDRPLPHDPAAFRRHPLTRFIEYELGVAVEPDGRWKRRTPRSLSEVAQQIAEQTNADPRHCARLLHEILTAGKGMNFKLHQFIRQGQTLYATLEPADRRTFSLDGQLQQEDGKRWIDEPVE